MLAQNFMTSTELNINDDLLSALIKVLGQLEREELKHVDGFNEQEGDGFNMNWWHEIHSCGTVCCIGGCAERHMGHIIDYPYQTERLAMLFHPGKEFGAKDWPDYDDITVPQAATALRNYLTRGHPNWEDTLA